MHVNFVCPICEYNTTEEAEERLRPAPARSVAAWKSPVAAKIAHSAIKQGRVRVLLEDEQDAAAVRELEQHVRVRVDRIDESTIEVWWK